MERDTSGFGLAYVKREGHALHPDDPMAWRDIEPPDEEFLAQLRRYRDGVGDIVFEQYCSRPELLKKLKESTSD